VVFSGTLPAGGSASLPLVLPALAGIEGSFFYLQGAVRLEGKTGLSNALPFRIEAAPPAGARHPIAIAATPDGTRAFVAHEEDGSISVIDAVNDVKLLDLPVGDEPADVAVDPDGRHVLRDRLGLALPQRAWMRRARRSRRSCQCRWVAGAWPSTSAPRRRSSTSPTCATTTLLVFSEDTPGHFTAQAPIVLQERASGAGRWR